MEIRSLNKKPTKLMVMLHGVGSDENDLISLAPFFQESLPEYHFFSPNGVEPYDMAPFGRQWFSLQDRSPNTIMNLVEKNTPIILKLIKNKQSELGLNNSDTVLFGFSQGAMIASYITLGQSDPFAAMVGCSGRLIPPRLLKNIKTPICIIHGQEDDIVHVDESKNMSEYCNQNNIKNQLLIVPSLKHSIDISGIEFAKKFLLNIVK